MLDPTREAGTRHRTTAIGQKRSSTREQTAHLRANASVSTSAEVSARVSGCEARPKYISVVAVGSVISCAHLAAQQLTASHGTHLLGPAVPPLTACETRRP
jgi:hypothetical protein